MTATTFRVLDLRTLLLETTPATIFSTTPATILSTLPFRKAADLSYVVWTPIEDMNSTATSFEIESVHKNLGIVLHQTLRPTTWSIANSKLDTWTWNTLHITVVVAGVGLLFVLSISMSLCLFYHKRRYRIRRARFVPSASPSCSRARKRIYSGLAAQETARRMAEFEAAKKKRTPSPKTVSEDIQMSMLRQMHSDEEVNNTTHRETQITGDGHHWVEKQQMGIAEVPQQKVRVFSRRVGPGLNTNITHPVPPVAHYNCERHLRTYPAANATDPMLDLNNNRGRRILPDPVARRTCTCQLTTTVPRSTHYRPPRYFPPILPKFNLAGENVATSSEQSMTSGTRAPENSLLAEENNNSETQGGMWTPYSFNPDSYGATCAVNSIVYVEGCNTPTPRLVVPANTPNSHCSGSVGLCSIGPGLDSDFGASAGVSQCNVSSNTSMSVAIGTADSSVMESSYDWDGYDPAYNNQIIEYNDGSFHLPVLSSRQYWV